MTRPLAGAEGKVFAHLTLRHRGNVKSIKLEEAFELIVLAERPQWGVLKQADLLFEPLTERYNDAWT